MGRVLFYSGLLIAGLAASQLLDLSAGREHLTLLTFACLSYIMIEVGLEFSIDKTRWRSYGFDYLVAATAAAFPWILCALQFMWFFQSDWKEAFLIARFTSPTSAGVLFAMLAAAGLATTWVFKKARVLAIFDDLDTVLFMIPLQMLFIGFKPQLIAVTGIIFALLFIAYRWLHAIRLPVGKAWLLGYGLGVVALCRWVEHVTHIHLEVLLPAFVMGAILFNPHDAERVEVHPHERSHLEPERGWPLVLDQIVKALFMFLVGCSLPKLEWGSVSPGVLVFHVLVATVLSNLGKCFPALCYRKEATLRERLALSVAMFPRGEVGGGVLLVAMGYGLSGLPLTVAGLSLALNLLLTGVFILIVQKLLASDKTKIQPKVGFQKSA